MSIPDDNRILGDDDAERAELEPFNRPRISLPPEEIARLEAEKKQMLAGRERTPLPDEIGGPRASRVGRGTGYPDQREPEPAPAPVEERSPRGPVTAEIAGSSPAGGASLSALEAFIRSDAVAASFQTLGQYRSVLLALLAQGR